MDPGNKMAEEIDFENGEKMPKCTVWGSRDLDLEVIWPSSYIAEIVSSISIHIPNMKKIRCFYEKLKWYTDGRTDGLTDIETGLMRYISRGDDLKKLLK